MAKVYLNIALISDLHCHPSSLKPHDTYFLSDLPGVPTKDNPLESLLELITTKKINADYLLVAGDITNKIDQQGFTSGWAGSKKIQEKLGAKDIIVTIGNHDVDINKKVCPEDPFFIARTLSNDFPTTVEKHWNEFYARGFYIFTNKDAIFLNLNSCFFHNNEKEAKRGKITEWQLEKLEKELTRYSKKTFKIALTHHHPHAHEYLKLGTDDIMYNGGNLLNLLNNYGFDILIHGHKHDPQISYSQGSTNSLAVLASGSFSAISNRMLSNTKNTFHLITLINKPFTNCYKQGIIETYGFSPGNGWSNSEKISPRFPSITGFGCRGILAEYVKEIEGLLAKKTNDKISWEDVLSDLPHLKFLIPQDLIKLCNLLKDKFIEMSPKPPDNPKEVGMVYE